MYRKWFASSLLMLISTLALADVSLLVPFVSKHYGCDPAKHKCEFHQFNPGLGLEWSSKEYDLGRPILRAAAYSDSPKNLLIMLQRAGARISILSTIGKSEWEFMLAI